MSHPWFLSINWKRLEAGKETPLFVPNPDCLYAKDLFDIRRFSKINGVKINENDKSLYEKFNTGAVSVSWQEEMIDTGVFDELNLFGPGGTRSYDLDFDLVPEPQPMGCLECFRYVFKGSIEHGNEADSAIKVNESKVKEDASNSTTTCKSPGTMPMQRLESFRCELDECKKTVKAVTRVCSNLSNKKSLTNSKTNLHRSTMEQRSTECLSTKTDYLNSTRLITSPS